MPLYEYQCDACGQRFEVIQKFSDPPVEVCRACGGGPVKKLLSSPAIQFKGSGWYITDYARKSGEATTSSSDSAKPSAPASKESKESSSSDTSAAKPAGPTSKDS
ncbi:MAG: FmdB family zinc ribbon protein [Vicinamibacterales bacterium]